MRLITIAALGAILAAGPAFADDIDAFAKSGLAGKWAKDCAKPASDTNYVQVWAIADGKVTNTSDSGKGAKPTAIETFGIGNSGKPFYIAAGKAGVLSVDFLVEPKRYRLWSSEETIAFVGGQVYVADGKVNGKDTDWYNKCE